MSAALRPPALPAVPCHWTLPSDPVSARRARLAVAEALPAGSRPQLADDLGLLASELVTNALRYGARLAEDVIELVLWPADGHFWLAVSDPGPDLPAPLRAVAVHSPQACGGRGLFLVDAVAAAWGVVPRRERGKSVIAGVRLHGG